MDDASPAADMSQPTPRRVRVALAVVTPGIGLAGLVAYAFGHNQGSFWAGLFGFLLAVPIALGAGLLTVLLCLALWGRGALTPDARHMGAIAALFAGMFGHVAFASWVAYVRWPPLIPTVERLTLLGDMPDVPAIPAAPSATLVDVPQHFCFPGHGTGDDPGVFFVDPATGAFRRWDLPAKVFCCGKVVWSPEAQSLFVIGGRSQPALHRISRGGADIEMSLPATAETSEDFVTPDGRTYVSWDRKSAGPDLPPVLRMSLRPLDGSSAARIIVLPVNHDWTPYRSAPAFSPDGRWLVYDDACEADACVFRVSREGGDRKILARFPGELMPQDLVVSPDGTKVAAAVQVPLWLNRELWIVDASGAGAQKVPLLARADGRDGDVEAIAWSPDGARLALLDTVMGELHDDWPDRFHDTAVYTVNLDGSGLVRLSERGQQHGRLVWLP